MADNDRDDTLIPLDRALGEVIDDLAERRDRQAREQLTEPIIPVRRAS